MHSPILFQLATLHWGNGINAPILLSVDQDQTWWHYSDVIMSPMASQWTGFSIVYSTVCPGPDQRKHQSSMSLTFVRGINRWSVNSRHKGSGTPKMFPFDDVMMDVGKIGWDLPAPKHNIQCNAVITGQSSWKSSQKTPHSSPVRSSYGVYFMGSHSDLYSARVTAVMYSISCPYWTAL